MQLQLLLLLRQEPISRQVRLLFFSPPTENTTAIYLFSITVGEQMEPRQTTAASVSKTKKPTVDQVGLRPIPTLLQRLKPPFKLFEVAL